VKKYLKMILSETILEIFRNRRNFAIWKKNGFLGSSPQLVKQNVFLKYGIRGAGWVETGTYLGTTTNYLSKLFPHVYSIEPEPNLYASACKRFMDENVTLFNDVSETVFLSLLPTLRGDINFWLDGHYSAGFTFKGNKTCPVEEELAAIEKNFDNFKKVAILIDDVRLFHSSNSDHADYPSIDYLVDWARRMKMSWRIEHDIFIMQNEQLVN
jgi:hypothetical protein